jgi:siroheme synthase (precorrin-2 oxidase/ferrochelatase)
MQLALMIGQTFKAKNSRVVMHAPPLFTVPSLFPQAPAAAATSIDKANGAVARQLRRRIRSTIPAGTDRASGARSARARAHGGEVRHARVTST